MSKPGLIVEVPPRHAKTQLWLNSKHPPISMETIEAGMRSIMSSNPAIARMREAKIVRDSQVTRLQIAMGAHKDWRACAAFVLWFAAVMARAKRSYRSSEVTWDLYYTKAIAHVR